MFWVICCSTGSFRIHCASGPTGQWNGTETVNVNGTFSEWQNVTEAALLSRCIIGALSVHDPGFGIESR